MKSKIGETKFVPIKKNSLIKKGYRYIIQFKRLFGFNRTAIVTNQTELNRFLFSFQIKIRKIQTKSN